MDTPVACNKNKVMGGISCSFDCQKAV